MIKKIRDNERGLTAPFVLYTSITLDMLKVKVLWCAPDCPLPIIRKPPTVEVNNLPSPAPVE